MNVSDIGKHGHKPNFSQEGDEIKWFPVTALKPFVLTAAPIYYSFSSSCSCVAQLVGIVFSVERNDRRRILLVMKEDIAATDGEIREASERKNLCLPGKKERSERCQLSRTYYLPIGLFKAS